MTCSNRPILAITLCAAMCAAPLASRAAESKPPAKPATRSATKPGTKSAAKPAPQAKPATKSAARPAAGAAGQAKAAAEAKASYIAEQLAEIDRINAAGPWKPDWGSLSRHEIPEWFKDAKLGIYAHWGVYCVPAFSSEWYPRRMYRPGDRDVFQHHLDTWGGPEKFGYKDFIPLFKAEKFNAQDWAALYERAGAKFAGPVAEHHDGFSMWASKVNRWNVKDMGPHRDTTGELVEALRGRGMKIITSFHHAFNIEGYYTPREGCDTADPQYADLYGQFKDKTLAYNRWLIKIKEVIDGYKPDQIWFDFGLRSIPEEYKKKMAAYYYNHEALWNKPVIITRKGNHLPEGVGALDIERAKMTGMGNALWQTDDSIATNSWCWVSRLQLKSAEELIHELIDIVSKRGVLLLNVCPKTDGTFPANEQRLLLDIGNWLHVNGEAIYATRPWKVHGEGPRLFDRGRGLGGQRRRQVRFTAQDVRYTQSKDGRTLYAIVLGWPATPLTLASVKVAGAGPDASVQLLGYDKPVEYSVNDKKQMVIQTPTLKESKRPCRFAYSFRLKDFQLDLQPIARRRMEEAEAITLTPERAELFGRSLRLDTKADPPRITNWKDPTSAVYWLANIFQAGKYRLRGELATLEGKDEQLTVEVAGRKLSCRIPGDPNADQPKVVSLGAVTIRRPGVYPLALQAADPVAWRGVNVWRLQLIPVHESP